MPDDAPRLLPPRVVVGVADGGAVDAGRRGLVKRPVVAVPLVLWLVAWSFWALWGIFVPLMVLAVGRNPRGVWKEIAGFLQYVLRVTAYLSLTVEPFPGYRNKNHDDYPVSLELEYPERLSRWLALARIVLNPLLAVVGFALILIMATATLIQLVTVLVYGRPEPRVTAFQVRQLTVHAHTFGFLLSLTDELPWRRARA
jgi:Domain of unknown function (DUF4389)